MALTDKLSAIGDAIRSKTGESSLIPLVDMPAAIRDIPTGGSERVTWHQCPEAVRGYLAAVAANPYDPSDRSYSYITDHAPSSPNQANTKPVGYTIDGVTFYDNEPNVALPFSTANKSGTLTALDKLRWYNTTPASPAAGSIYDRGKNCRDLGGWNCDGGTVRYGLLIRGSEPNPADKALMVDKIGIKTEVQLLPVSEQATDFKMKSAWGIDWAGNDTDSDSVYSISDSPALWKKLLSAIFDSVTHNKPVYFHCGVGADRTGIIAIMLEAILGVSQSDIDTDFELTDFAVGWSTISGNQYRTRAYPTYVALMEAMENIPLVGGLSDTFRNRCISFVLSLGFTVDEINAFRAACIDGAPDTITVNLPSYSVTKSGSNVVFGNDTASVNQYQGYEVSVKPAPGYVITNVGVTMGGVSVNAFSGEKTNLYRRVTYDLHNCSINNNKYSCIDGQGFGATVTPDAGYTLDGATVSITMGGVEVSQQYYSNGAISIPNVTGNVVISVTAVRQGPSYTNLADMTGGDWKTNSRIRSIGAIASAATSDVTNCFSVAAGDIIRTKGVCGSSEGYTDFSHNAVMAVFADASATSGTAFVPASRSYDEANDILTLGIPSGTSGLMRFMVFHNYMSSDIIITRNEEIV